MGLEKQMSEDVLRQARDASSAHLEAVLKVDGARYLRLAYLRDQLNAEIPMDLKSEAGAQPQLWLDLAHCITMEPDAKAYRLSYHGVDRIETLLETDDIDEMLKSAKTVLAHRRVQEARRAVENRKISEWHWMTLLYIWMTGVISGFALLAVYAIVMKKLPF